MLSDAFIHARSDARNQARRIYTQWVKNKRGRFSSVSTGFLKVGFPRVAADLQDGGPAPVSTPEPSFLVMMGSGLATLVWTLGRRNRA
jgi:hypothetical protein